MSTSCCWYWVNLNPVHELQHFKFSHNLKKYKLAVKESYRKMSNSSVFKIAQTETTWRCNKWIQDTIGYLSRKWIFIDSYQLFLKSINNLVIVTVSWVGMDSESSIEKKSTISCLIGCISITFPGKTPPRQTHQKLNTCAQARGVGIAGSLMISSVNKTGRKIQSEWNGNYDTAVLLSEWFSRRRTEWYINWIVNFNFYSLQL